MIEELETIRFTGKGSDNTTLDIPDLTTSNVGTTGDRKWRDAGNGVYTYLKQDSLPHRPRRLRRGCLPPCLSGCRRRRNPARRRR